MTVVLGVDGCPGGWCAVALDSSAGTIIDLHLYPAFAAVIETAAAVICVDIPIGLLDRPGKRACDVESRRMLGRGRASSVFPAPSRPSLRCGDYRAASNANFQVTGRKLSKQSFNISPKVCEVDEVMKPGRQERVREVHPELCFSVLNGGAPIKAKKNHLAGRFERWELLRAYLSSLPATPPKPSDLPGGCQPDDYIDALVCAWTALCIARGSAQRIPPSPSVDERGLRMVMWMPAPIAVRRPVR